MVPTFTCGFLRSNTPFAMTLTSDHDFQLPISDCRFQDTIALPFNRQLQIGNRQFQELPQGLEPWTSTLPRWRSTTELWQQRRDRHLFRSCAWINSARTGTLEGRR